MPEQVMETESLRPVQLELFDHQVGGHHSMLRFNETTLCKPLIPREHEFYNTLPGDLKEFTPEYRGIIEVQLHEDSNGYITLMGYPQELRNSVTRTQGQSPKHHSGLSSPESSGSDPEIDNTLLHPALHPNDQNAASNGLEQQRSNIRLLRNGSIEVSMQTEEVFYSVDSKMSRHKKASLNPWSLKCHKEQLAKMRKSSQESDNKFILLENVAATFKCPCILDLKMGTRQHGDDASDVKRDTQVKKCAATTSKSLGMRVCGMQVYQQNSHIYVSQDKYYGRSLEADTFQHALHQFLHNGHELRLSLIDPIIHRLEKLYGTVKRQDTFRFYSSSLLIMYDGSPFSSMQEGLEENANSDVMAHNRKSNTGDDSRNEWMQDAQIQKDVVDVKMIDFAHVTHRGFRDDDTLHSGPDAGYLFGLKNLIQLFRELHDKYAI